jgi:hypothetical protein
MQPGTELTSNSLTIARRSSTSNGVRIVLDPLWGFVLNFSGPRGTCPSSLHRAFSRAYCPCQKAYSLNVA